MKKKIIAIVSVIMALAICCVCLVACNPYPQDAILGGDPTAAVESNGGYVVKQGDYLYYINGYEGSEADNEWGTPTLQTIVRTKIVNGKPDNSTTVTVVPKSIYNSSANGGIVIHDGWIYYATPNYDKDDSGKPSTSNTDFMRTKIDGSATQRLGTIGTRSAEYLFTSTRVLYYNSNNVYYIDFSDVKSDKSSDSLKGLKTGTLVEGATSLVWKLGCDKIYYTKNPTSESESYKNYNNLCSVKIDGSSPETLATENTFLESGENAQDKIQSVYKYSLRDMYVESDGTVTLYYTKTYHVDSDVQYGLCCAKEHQIKQTEKRLNSLSSTTLVPLGYEDGAFAYNANSVYCWYNGTNAENPLQIGTTSQTIWKVDAQNKVVYMTASSSASALLKISYDFANGTTSNQTNVMEESIKVDWLKLDFVGNNFYFFAANDKNYLHYIDLTTFDKNDEEAKSTYLGFVLDEDEDND